MSVSLLTEAARANDGTNAGFLVLHTIRTYYTSYDVSISLKLEDATII